MLQRVLVIIDSLLLQVLEALLVQLGEQCSWLLESSMAPQSGLHSFDFLGSSILAAVDEQLASSMPGKSSSIMMCISGEKRRLVGGCLLESASQGLQTGLGSPTYLCVCCCRLCC